MPHIRNIPASHTNEAIKHIHRQARMQGFVVTKIHWLRKSSPSTYEANFSIRRSRRRA